jgi:hypothetical protein
MNENLAITQFYYGAGHVGDLVLIGGAQDNGTLGGQSGGPENWQTIFGGDGGDCAIDPNDSHRLYGEYIYLQLFRSTEGQSVEHIDGEYYDGTQGQWLWRPFPYSIPDAQLERAGFVAPFLLDPNNSDRLLGGGMSLWETRNVKQPYTANVRSGPAWRFIKPPAGSEISALAMAAGQPDLIWVGHNAGDLYVTTNGTRVDPRPNWQKVDDNGPATSHLPNDRICTGITIDPRDAQRAYVTFSGFFDDNLWTTPDRGTSWSKLGGTTLPHAPMFALAVHPDRSDHLYLATEVDVYGSSDSGQTWGPLNGGPTNCQVRDLFWLNKTLIAVTHGRGIYQNNLANVPPPP